jgi:uncharacterized protein with PQ loop repeat
LPSLTDGLAVLAAGLGVAMAASPLLQALHSHRRQSAQDVSVSFLSVLLSGNAAWLLYGSQIDNLVIVIPNAVGVAASGATLVMTVRARRLRVGSTDPVCIDANRSDET